MKQQLVVNRATHNDNDDTHQNQHHQSRSFYFQLKRCRFGIITIQSLWMVLILLHLPSKCCSAVEEKHAISLIIHHIKSAQLSRQETETIQKCVAREFIATTTPLDEESSISVEAWIFHKKHKKKKTNHISLRKVFQNGALRRELVAAPNYSWLFDLFITIMIDDCGRNSWIHALDDDFLFGRMLSSSTATTTTLLAENICTCVKHSGLTSFFSVQPTHCETVFNNEDP